MPHKCVKCSQVYPDGAKQLLKGCDKCGSRFFYFLRKDSTKIVPKLTMEEAKEIEKDIKRIIGKLSDDDRTIILDLETIQVTESGKYSIDLTKMFDRERPIIYKIRNGKYIIDLSSSPQKSKGF